MNDARPRAEEEMHAELNFHTPRRESSRGRVHPHQARVTDIDVLPALRQRLMDLEHTNARTTTDLVDTQRLLRAFQQETYALRTLIKFSDYPDQAASARAEGERQAALDEVKRLRESLTDLQTDYATCQKRCDEALMVAEQYRRQLEVRCGDGVDDEEYRSEAPVPVQRDPRQPSLPGHKRRADGATGAGSLTEDDATSRDTGSEGEEPNDDHDALMCEGHDQARHRRATTDPTRKASSSQVVAFEHADGHDSDRLSHSTLTVSDVSDAEAAQERTRKAVSILQGENTLLTRRVANVVSQNRHFIATIAELEMRCAQLSNSVGCSP